MRKLSWYCLLIIIVLLCPSFATAQDFSRKLAVGLRGGFWKLGLTEHSDSNTVGNLATLFFRYDVKEKLALGFSATYARTWEADLSQSEGTGARLSFSKKDEANRSTQIWLDFSLMYRFRPWERLNPYVYGGAGIAFWNLKDKDGKAVEVLDKGGNPFDVKDQELTVSLGGGLEYRFKEKWGLDFGTRFRILSHLFTSFNDSKDIVGSQPGELDLPKATLEFFLGVNYYFGKLMDTDKDGVPDRKDFCADTPFGAKADERGCPLDSDGDGIYDGLDRCPDTSPGSDVDVNGCPLQE